MALILKEKIKVGVSACNFGAKVRWNRKGWDRVASLEREKDNFIWTPICPEVNCGLGVTRPPIRLVGGNGDDLWAGNAQIKNKNGIDVTLQIKEGLQASLEIVQRAGIEAFVFMEGSPTCGVYRTTLKNRRLGKRPVHSARSCFRRTIFSFPPKTSRVRLNGGIGEDACMRSPG